MPNDDQIAMWNGPSGETWVAMQERLDNQIEPLGRATIAALAPREGERIVDVGCGAGQSTIELAQRVGATGSVLGIDISEPLVAVARRRAGGAATFLVADAQVHAFEPASYDAVFSRFGVMFFDDPTAAFTNLARALRPGGRLAFLCWRRPDENPIMTAPLAAAIAAGLPPPAPGVPDAPGPFAFANPERVTRILGAAGFHDIVPTPHDEAVGGNDLDATVDMAFQVGPLSRQLREHPDRRAAVVDAVRASIATFVVGGVVKMPSATWIVTARRR